MAGLFTFVITWQSFPRSATFVTHRPAHERALIASDKSKFLLQQGPFILYFLPVRFKQPTRYEIDSPMMLCELRDHARMGECDYM